MMQLEMAARRAAATVGTDKTALSPVARVHLSDHCTRDVARRRLSLELRSAGRGRTRVSGLCKSPLHLLFDQQICRAFNDLAEITVGYLMPHEVLQAQQFVMQSLRRRELHLVSARAQRSCQLRRLFQR